MGHVYDNMNWMEKVAEQTVGRKDAQQNGTCATVFPLYDASREDMKTDDLLASTDAAPLLTVSDILLSSNEDLFQRQCLIHAILRIIITHGGDDFARFKADVSNCLPQTDDSIPVHKTDIYPLPVMDIDESSIVGNAEVIETMFEELGYPVTSPESQREVKVISGDLLSITNLRSAGTTRIGHEHPSKTFANCATTHGFFHGQLHQVFGAMSTHWGTQSVQNPGSLAFHNTVLGRKPIVLSSLPPYRTCRDLIFVSLYARVLYCLELICGYPSLDKYSKTVTFDELKSHAELIYERFANPEEVRDLREARAREIRRNAAAQEAQDEAVLPDLPSTLPPPKLKHGDMVFENASLFLRDALIIREFTDAIKVGDSGRLVICIKTFALNYRGHGRTKYAHEMLHLIHNLTHVWPKPLRYVFVFVLQLDLPLRIFV